MPAPSDAIPIDALAVVGHRATVLPLTQMLGAAAGALAKMEAHLLIRFFDEHKIAPSAAAGSRPDGPLDYLRVTLHCSACGSTSEFALRDCMGISPRCTCGNAFDSAGVEELITRVAGIPSAKASSPGATAMSADGGSECRRFPILLVEDDAASELLTVKAIHRADIPCEVHVARDGRQAVEFLSSPTLPFPDLVLLDLSMPVMDGFDVLRFARADETLRHLTIVMLTTSTQPDTVDEAYRLGANGYVVKGGSLAKFRDDISATLRFWLTTSVRSTMASRTRAHRA